MDYKAQTTLNEKDSLQDMLILEKTLAKVYATALTEGASSNYKKLIKTHFNGVIENQTEVFNKMTEKGYYKIEEAPENILTQTKDKFSKIKKDLS